MSFPRYPSYKDSGVEWLGEVPEHWEVYKLQDLANSERYSFVDGPFGSDLKNEEYTESGIPLIQLNNINEGAHVLNSIKYVSTEKADQLRRHNAFPGDIVIAKMADPVARAAIVNDSFSRYVIVADCIRLSVKDTFAAPTFAVYAINSPYFRSHAIGLSSGITRLRINLGALKQIRLALPTLPEQTQIAAFLDRETAKIDELVAEQRRLMELLKEEIISLVLSSFRAPETSGLRLSEVSTIISRPVIQKAEESYTRIGLFNRGRGLFHKDASEMDDMGESDFFWIEEGDLIISGQFAWEGAIALADQEDTGCVVSHRYPVIRGKAGVALTEYLFGLLCTKHGDFLMNENSRGAAGRNRPLNISSLMKEKIPVPNMEIQKKVARAVHTRKALFKEIAKAIDLLQERRTALISAAVTGQIDVRPH